MSTLKEINCEKAIETALLRTSLEAAPDDIILLEHHLKKCPSCKREVDDINMAISSYRTMRKPKLPEFTRSRILDAVKGCQSQPRQSITILPKLLRLASSAIATAAVIMFAFIGLNRPLYNNKPVLNIPKAEASAMKMLNNRDLPTPETTLVILAGEDISEASSLLDFVDAPSSQGNRANKFIDKELEKLNLELFETLIDA